MATRDRIPGHLRQYVVEHDPQAYDEIDQGVWRFVLLQMYERGMETAHPAYVRGLAQTGISVERIPSIDQMDRCLSEFGWGAVAVDGFIPPRAFQEFQAHSILTIAAEIRTPEHLAYTPAPDIIHESAGHAPIVPDAEYRQFLQRFGEVGARAFSSAEDEQLYQAVRRLSALKEDSRASPETLRGAESDLEAAQQAATELSEAALLSRLHWWTVEYGLIGRPDDYKMYGAGLLSSLGESHFLPGPNVRKLPLSARCIEVGYDITAPQPQLFVAESFAQLTDVLEEVASGLAQRAGGRMALERALRAREVSSFELTSGLEVIGIPEEILGDLADPVYLRLGGPCALASKGRLLPGQDPSMHPTGYGTPLGRLESGESLECMRAADLERRAAPDRALELRFRSGVRVRGRWIDQAQDADGRLRVITFDDCTVLWGQRVLFEPSWGRFDLAIGDAVVRAYAGPSDAAFWPTTEFSTLRVPHPRGRTGSDAILLSLYRRALDEWKDPSAASLRVEFERIHVQLQREFPKDWLLRWNLLECLHKLGEDRELAAALRRELLAIEHENDRELPISTGLRYLDRHYRRTRPA